MLHVDTKVPTPYGWTRVGDLAPGSVVFDELGYPVFVRQISDPVTEKVFRVGLTNKTSERGAIYVTEGHELCTWDRDSMRILTRNTGIKTIPTDWAEHDGKKRPLSQIRENISVPEGTTRKYKHVIPMTFPLVLPVYTAPIPPYILGLAMNLHDRHSGLMHCKEHMWDWYESQFAEAGFTVLRTKKRLKRPKPDGDVTFSSGQLNRLLNQQNSYMSKGIIPPQYLRGSSQQRMELLSGLVDYPFQSARNHQNGVHVWCGKNDERFEQILELVRSLGFAAVPLLHQSTKSWIVRWTPVENPYRYPKFRAQIPDFGHLKRNTFQKFCWRIQSVELDSEAQVRSIEVTSPSGLITVSDLFIPVVGGMT